MKYIKYIIVFLLGALVPVALASTVNLDVTAQIAAWQSVISIANTQIAALKAAQPVTPPPVVKPPVTTPLTVKLITNETAFWNPTTAGVLQSPLFQMDSGSLFQYSDGRYWTGVPDTITPNALSTNGNNSAVFRLYTKAKYLNETTSFDYVKNGLVSSASLPAVAWDGGHIFLRAQSEYNLYYASFDRRDNMAIIKKKCVGGPAPSNGGTYYELNSATSHTITSGTSHHIAASIVTNSNNTVTIKLFDNNALISQATDSGMGCAVITNQGATGVRFDNNDATFSNFLVN